MKNYKILLSAAALALASCSVSNNSSNNGDSTASSIDSTTQNQDAPKTIYATMQIADTVKIGQPVNLKFTVYNPADTASKFLKWHTPFEPPLSKYVDIKGEDGQEANYKGAMAKRMMPPPADSYINVAPGDSTSATADLSKSYAIEKPGKYTVVYNSTGVSGLTVKDSVSFVYVK
ncbi:protease [Mucilaginibacter sp. UR6-1]|uniref:protease n=1 Tax=Mucilaginibacter sp. UR6-1 TaxID=1435643 RepID=UPI001E3C5470|nr:protease [Mucilaginibacter sp. UR6-1]MCC8409689.1 protease [Mucilaginibacter sp. UR6-1]